VAAGSALAAAGRRGGRRSSLLASLLSSLLSSLPSERFLSVPPLQGGEARGAE
jgi:hypothetical protein